MQFELILGIRCQKTGSRSQTAAGLPNEFRESRGSINVERNICDIESYRSCPTHGAQQACRQTIHQEHGQEVIWIRSDLSQEGLSKGRTDIQASK